jgi:GNAT superfamily N-acetyltransferase
MKTVAHDAIQIRKLNSADLAWADSLRVAAGWNQTIEDWQIFLLLDSEGCFVAEWHGRPAGTATTIRYGRELAWIGMLLVHPEFRRRGLGRALLGACLDYLHGCGVACVKLDATPAGSPLYESFGLRREWSLARWRREGDQAPIRVPSRNVQPCESELDESVLALDRRAFGVSRRNLLVQLRSRGITPMVVSDSRVAVGGYGLTRAGSQAQYLGPVVARSPQKGEALILALLDRAGPGPVIWDLPDDNEAARRLAVRLGFKTERPLIRMFLGDNTQPGDPGRQFAIADPAWG